MADPGRKAGAAGGRLGAARRPPPSPASRVLRLVLPTGFPAAILAASLAASAAARPVPDGGSAPDSAAGLPVDGASLDAGAPVDAATPEVGEDPGEDRPPLFMETYTEGVYSRHEQDNASGFTDVKLGKRFDPGRPVDVYLKARMHRDQRDFFWNNHIDAGVGARVNLLKGAALSVYAEWLGGFYYRTDASLRELSALQSRIERNRDALQAVQEDFEGTLSALYDRRLFRDTVFTRPGLDSLYQSDKAHYQRLLDLDKGLDSLETVKDSLALIPAGPLTEFRAGFMFWYGRGQEPAPGEASSRPVSLPFRFWCDLYADGTFSALSRTVQSRRPEGFRDSTARFVNFILYANPDVGLVVLDGEGGSLTAYATAYAWWDTHKDWWNNRAMAGPGLRHKPFRGLDLVIACEYLWGAYYGRERDEDPNPYSSTFQDVRLLASFWYGLGF